MYIENKSHGETQLYAILLLNSFKEKIGKAQTHRPILRNNLKQFQKPSVR